MVPFSTNRGSSRDGDDALRVGGDQRIWSSIADDILL